MPVDVAPLVEEQILSTTDKITKPVDTDAEAMRHNDLGVAFVFKGDLGQAIDEFKHALRLQANYFAAHLNLANTLLDVGKHDDAIAEFKEALRLKPDDLKAHNDLGVALKEMGDLGGAIAEFKTVLRHRPSDVNAHNNLGVALKSMGDLDGALAEYRTAASLQPNDINAHFNLGLALMEKRNPDAAIGEFRTALHLRPDDAKIRFNLGNALAGTGQRMEAAQEFKNTFAWNSTPLRIDAGLNRPKRSCANWRCPNDHRGLFRLSGEWTNPPWSTVTGPTQFSHDPLADSAPFSVQSSTLVTGRGTVMIISEPATVSNWFIALGAIVLMAFGLTSMCPTLSLSAEPELSQTQQWNFDGASPGSLPGSFVVGTLFDGRPAGEWKILITDRAKSAAQVLAQVLPTENGPGTQAPPGGRNRQRQYRSQRLLFSRGRKG